MKVYVLIGGWKHEDSEVIGVYSTREKVEKANDLLKSTLNRGGGYEFTDIQEMDIDKKYEGG